MVQDIQLMYMHSILTLSLVSVMNLRWQKFLLSYVTGPDESIMRVQYTVMAEASWSIMWLRNLYHEIGYTQNDPTLLVGDNQSVLAIATNLQYHNQSRHFALDKHFIRKTIQMGATRLEYCCTDDMVADVLTKALPHEKHTQHTKHLGLTEAWGGVLWHKLQRAEYHNTVYYYRAS